MAQHYFLLLSSCSTLTSSILAYLLLLDYHPHLPKCLFPTAFTLPLFSNFSKNCNPITWYRVSAHFIFFFSKIVSPNLSIILSTFSSDLNPSPLNFLIMSLGFFTQVLIKLFSLHFQDSHHSSCCLYLLNQCFNYKLFYGYCLLQILSQIYILFFITRFCYHTTFPLQLSICQNALLTTKVVA